MGNFVCWFVIFEIKSLKERSFQPSLGPMASPWERSCTSSSLGWQWPPKKEQTWTCSLQVVGVSYLCWSRSKSDPVEVIPPSQNDGHEASGPRCLKVWVMGFSCTPGKGFPGRRVNKPLSWLVSSQRGRKRSHGRCGLCSVAFALPSSNRDGKSLAKACQSLVPTWEATQSSRELCSPLLRRQERAQPALYLSASAQTKNRS